MGRFLRGVLGKVGAAGPGDAARRAQRGTAEEGWVITIGNATETWRFFVTFYLGVHSDPTQRMASVWSIGDQIATCIDARQEATVLSLTPSIVIEHLPNWRFVPLKLEPGEFYPRIARPSSTYFKDSPGLNPDIDKALVETSSGQLRALREQLERIFRTVHPAKKNFETYGHDIRNVLILASTEVEGHWKGILKANGARNETTKDYVKLLPAMKLDEYAITLPFYPWLEPIRPFLGWQQSLPTQSLRWYDAYNAVKHDRETSFERGTLLDALQAVCGVAVLLFAQFGKREFHNEREINSFFQLTETPQWDGSEVYPVPGPNGSFIPKQFPF
jgi:hypothetical protein